ncbi:MAG: hypothetical protein SWY16_05850 [Cyanobacteriota bacterium]|nr:hypothetical protein [Cyanobacteriota bacterium]
MEAMVDLAQSQNAKVVILGDADRQIPFELMQGQFSSADRSSN